MFAAPYADATRHNHDNTKWQTVHITNNTTSNQSCELPENYFTIIQHFSDMIFRKRLFSSMVVFLNLQTLIQIILKTSLIKHRHATIALAMAFVQTLSRGSFFSIVGMASNFTCFLPSSFDGIIVFPYPISM